MNFEEAPNAPEPRTKVTRDQFLVDFINSGFKVAKITEHNYANAAAARGAIFHTVKRYGYLDKVGVYQRGDDVFLERLDLK